ncbi:MAG: NAD(P)-dependent oxidoreductase [Saccharofermentans sp.]|nr:NAD(P)-dependent oxidoreductase [Saccharofermentans sp.]
MKIAVLGSTGYIGQRIVRSLIDDDSNHQIWCIHRKTSNIDVFDDIKDKLHFCHSYYQDMLDCFTGTESFDCIINASCSYMKNATAEQITESNLIFPLRALNMAVENPGDKTIFISLGTGLPDDFNIYTFAKAQLNSFGHFWGYQKRQIHYVNIEMQNFFGPGEPKDRFVHSCIEKLKNNEPVPLTNGLQKRDFFYVDDVINAIKLVLKHPELPRYLDLPLGSGEAPTIREFVSYLKKKIDSKSELQFGAVPTRVNEPSIWADLSTYHMLGGSIEYSWQGAVDKLLKEEGII